MDADLKARVAEAAAANNRSMNAEIVARLEAGAKTLRDEFAMAALVGRLSHGFANASDMEAHARSAYQAADAMLAARKP